MKKEKKEQDILIAENKDLKEQVAELTKERDSLITENEELEQYLIRQAEEIQSLSAMIENPMSKVFYVNVGDMPEDLAKQVAQTVHNTILNKEKERLQKQRQ